MQLLDHIKRELQPHVFWSDAAFPDAHSDYKQITHARIDH